MLKREAVIETSLTYWHEDRQEYLTESPVLDALLGSGKTPEASLDDFIRKYDCTAVEQLLFEAKVNFQTTIKPTIKAEITRFALDKGIAKGDAVAFLWRFYDCFHHSVALHTYLSEKRRKAAQLERLR